MNSYELEQALACKQMEVEDLRQRLTKINDTIYAVGAPLGSEAYFTIRKICCDNAEKKEQSK